VPEVDPASPLLAVLSAAATGFLVGILPVGLAEVAAVGIGLVHPPGLALAMLAAFTVGHVGAKVPWYVAGTLGERAPAGRVAGAIGRARAFLAARPGYGTGVLAVSALTSIPPFHLSAIAAGLVRLPFVRFMLICLAGRAVRFGALASVPSLLHAWVG